MLISRDFDSDQTCSYHRVLEKCVGDLITDTKTIKNTLIGEDLRGGMVADVLFLKNAVNQIQQELVDFKQKKDAELEFETARSLNTREKYVLYGTAITAISTAAAAIVEFFIGSPLGGAVLLLLP